MMYVFKLGWDSDSVEFKDQESINSIELGVLPDDIIIMSYIYFNYLQK